MQTKACLVHLAKRLKPFLSKKNSWLQLVKIGRKMQKIAWSQQALRFKKISFELVLFISRALSVCILVILCPSNMQ